LFAFKANVFEVSGIPQRVEVAFEGGRIVNVSGMSEDSGFNSFGGDAAIATDVNSGYHVLLPYRPGTEQEKSQEEAQQRTLSCEATS
jgi:hypothetical protein